MVGATDSVALRAVRAECPDVWLLAPGLGAQGGDMLQARLLREIKHPSRSIDVKNAKSTGVSALETLFRTAKSGVSAF